MDNRNNKEQDAFCIALKKDCLIGMQLMIDKGFDVTKPYFHTGNYSQTYKSLLRKNVGENASYLHLAAAYNACEGVKLLLDQGLSVKAVNSYRQNPLFMAISFSGYDCLKLLIERIKEDKDLNFLDDNNCNLLHYAVANRDEKAVELLVSKDVASDVVNVFGKTPLDCAQDILDQYPCDLTALRIKCLISNSNLRKKIKIK